ncbi:hypothetical protein [Streptomyces profundus]|uniref:hypothetical protein n=1 Tax=Streptomyces profundus TaxID=2867410 RepID=UPI001D1622E4|nr:hypothetical protein [Streptomyces sp. MA3_2.13]UED85127.1 hypothetical protein K4G22_13735 [Streptomyces sp. MA3_2.13]
MAGRRVLRHRWRFAGWLLSAVTAIVCGGLNAWASTRDRGPFAPETSVSATEYALWTVLTVACLRIASRRMVLTDEGAVLVGSVRNRRVRWADVVEVELAQRTGSTQPGGRWRIALRMRDDTARWVPSFVHGAMGLHRAPEFGPGDRGRYGQVFHQAPPHAPRELARLHGALRAAWLRAGGVPQPPPPPRRRADRLR